MQIKQSQFNKGEEMKHFIRVNMDNLSVSSEEVSQEYALLGGRGLIARIMNQEVLPDCDPWGRHNKIIIATGFFSGTSALSSCRISVGGKSPLTGGIKEASSGGAAGNRLGRLGVKAIICEGKPREKKTYLIRLDRRGAEIREDAALAGLTNYETVERLHAQYGDKVAIISIGKAGEMRYANSTVAVTDAEGRPCRHAGRGGLGSVLGTKGIKAIVVDDEGTDPVPMKDEETFKQIVKEHAKTLKEDKGLILLLSTYGIAGAVNMNNEMGGLPTRNFREGRFEGVENITGERMAELRETRGGKMHACMPTCVIGCSPIYHDKDGNYLTSGFEYESHAMLGSNLGIDDLDGIAEMDRLCDEYGLDTIETGATLAVCAEAGLMDFGDSRKAKELINEMGQGSLMGRVLGQGAVIAGRVLGVSRVAAVKGQGMPAHEPRIFKATGVTLATSPMGADHTAGLVFNPGIGPEEAVDISLQAQAATALLDSTGCCSISYGTLGLPIVKNLLNAQYGLELTDQDVIDIGRNVLEEEKRFNREAGITEAHNRLPEFFFEETLPPLNASLGITPEQLKEVK